jgi:hypothetical protein
MAQKSKPLSAAPCASASQQEQRKPQRAPTGMVWRGGYVPARINDKTAGTRTRCFLRAAVTLLGLAVALSGAIVASIHVEPQKSHPDRSTRNSEALVSLISESSSRNHRKQLSLQLSLRPGFAYSDLQSIKQRTPVPSDPSQFKLTTHPYPAKTAFAPKGEFVHEYWRAMSGPSTIVERYEAYLHAHPSGNLADIVVERITDLSQRPEPTHRF